MRELTIAGRRIADDGIEMEILPSCGPRRPLIPANWARMMPSQVKGGHHQHGSYPIDGPLWGEHIVWCCHCGMTMTAGASFDKPKWKRWIGAIWPVFWEGAFDRHEWELPCVN